MAESKIRISFMFLGGFPDLSSDVGRAWKNWILHANTHHPSYLKKIMFVTHPMSNSFKLSKGWKKILGSKILFYALTKEKEHLRTAWATRSLVDATILMIRKSFELSRFVQKFIVLDATSCPLYNLKVIYTTITSNRLNWLDSPLLYSNCKDVRENQDRRDLPALRCSSPHPSYCFKERDCSFWSQWCILDVTYLQDLLKSNIVKDQILINCPNTKFINQIVVRKTAKTTKADQKIDATLGAFVDSFSQRHCVISDEMYFGMFLKKNRSISEFLNIIFLVKVTALLSKYDKIKHVKLKVRRIEPITQTSSSSSGGPHNTWLIDPLLFGENVDVTHYGHYGHYGPGGHHNVPTSLQKFPFFINPFRLNDRIVRPSMYTIPSTYTDWRYANPDPINIFRSFEYKGSTISDLIDQDPTELINWLKSLNGWDQTFSSLKMNIIPYWSHPMQFNTRSVKIFINAYNILEYFSKMGTDEKLQELRDMYENILKTYMTKKEIAFHSSSSQQTVFIIFVVNVENKFKFATLKKGSAEPTMGCPVTNDVLNQARMRGGLFIRKCENGSYIHAFSTQLFETNSYLYQHLLKKRT